MTTRLPLVIRVLETTYPQARIQALQRQTAMTAATPLVIERCGSDPYGHFYGESQALGAFLGEELVGYVHGVVAPTRMLVAGTLVTEPGLYFGDLRIDDRQRRRGLAVALLDRLAALGRECGAVRGYCYVNEGNEGMLRLLARGNSRLQGKPVSHFQTASRLLVWKPSLKRQPRFQQQPLSALRLDDLLRRRAEGVFCVDLEAEWLHKVAAKAGDYIRCFAAVEAPGQLAFVLWNQECIRQLRLLNPDIGSRLTMKAWQLLSAISGGHSPPARGEAFRMAELCWVADPRIVEEPDEAIAAAWDMGAHILNVPAGDKPPVGPFWQSLKTHVVAFGIDQHPLPGTGDGLPVTRDLSWI